MPAPDAADVAELLVGRGGDTGGTLATWPRNAAGTCPAARELCGARFATELFCPRFAAVSHQSRHDMSMLGQTSCVQTTRKLHRDFGRIADGNAVYWPACLCPGDDLSLFSALLEELAPWEPSPYRRSRHPACIDEARLLASHTYRQVVAKLRRVFDFRVGYSIVNLYSDGDDWTEYHRDNYRAEGSRISVPGGAGPPSPHNVTVGVSLGAPRELRFRHLETSLEFGFPQGNGDVFAFTDSVNSAFQHCVPRYAPARAAGPRISVILWGRTEHAKLLGPTAPGGRG